MCLKFELFLREKIVQLKTMLICTLLCQCSDALIYLMKLHCEVLGSCRCFGSPVGDQLIKGSFVEAVKNVHVREDHFLQFEIESGFFYSAKLGTYLFEEVLRNILY